MTKKDKIDLLRERINIFFKVNIEKRSRENSEVYARAVYYHICKILDPTMTTTSIANTVNRKHCTVVYSLNKFKTAYEYDKKFKHLYDSFMTDYPVYLKEQLFRNRNTDNLVSIIDFISTLDFDLKIKFIDDIEKLKETYKQTEYERVL